jgi:hypothetical protein
MAIAAVTPITRYLKWAPHHSGTITNTHQRKEKIMKENNKENNRVLSRQNARELTSAEVDHVTGSINTLTFCSASPKIGTNDCDTLG